MKSWRVLPTTTVLLAIGLSGCVPKDDTKKAEAEVDRFHEHWSAREFATVYNEAHHEFQAAQPPSKTISSLENSRRVFGAFKSAKMRSSDVTFEHVEKDVILRYDSAYEHGSAYERLTYRISAGKPLLLNYYILPPEAAAKYEAEEAAKKTRKAAGQ